MNWTRPKPAHACRENCCVTLSIFIEHVFAKMNRSLTGSVVVTIAAFTGCLFFSSCISVQKSSATNIPEANVVAPSTNATPAELHRTLPILFIVGDSTVHNSARGLLGWGDVV